MTGKSVVRAGTDEVAKTEAQHKTATPMLDYLLIERALLGSLPIDQLNLAEKIFV